MKLFIVSLLASTVPLVPAAIFTGDDQARIESFVEAVMNCKNMPGLTLAVVKGDETWTRGFGLADIERGVAVSPDSLFGVGSLSKAFTTMLIGMLLNDTNGRYTWTSKVSDILGPDFAFVDYKRTFQLTLRDLLTHRTGLMPADLPLLSGYDRKVTRKEFARRFRFLPEEKPVRDVWEYNNMVYALAGYIVEVLSGDTYEETLDKRIFQPLGMRNSRVLGKTVTINDEAVAKPYFIVENQLELTDSALYNIHPAEAAGSIASSADDMAKWMHFLFRDGMTSNNQSLITSNLFKELFKAHEVLSDRWINSRSIYRPQYPINDVHFGYGYGWVSSAVKGYRKFWHSGGFHSYIAYLHMYPDLKSGVFINTNGPGISGTGTAQQVISFYILDVLLGEEPWLDTSTACTYPEPWKSAGASTNAESTNTESTNTNSSDATDNSPAVCMECFTGRYGHQLYGDLDVTMDTESGILMMYYGKLRGTLNSTDNEANFRLDIGGPLRVLSHPGNRTLLIPVTFRDKTEGIYQSLDINFPYSMTFSRNISFADETSSGQSLGSNSVFTLCTVIIVCLIPLLRL